MDTPHKPRRVWRIVFALSLALNVLLIGAIGGAYARLHDGGRPGALDLQMGSIANALPRRDRAQIGKVIRDELRADRPTRGTRRAAINAMMAALEADPFDPVALSNLIAEQQMLQDRVRDVALTAFVSHVAQMTSQERSELADALRAAMVRRGPQRQNERNRP